MAFQTKSFIDGKKTAMIYQTTDTIADSLIVLVFTPKLYENASA
jgi:hypothetical protein